MFKILAIIILVVLGLYLYKRAQRLAEEEQQQALNESLKKRREEYQAATQAEADAKEKEAADKDVIEGEIIEQAPSKSAETEPLEFTTAQESTEMETAETAEDTAVDTSQEPELEAQVVAEVDNVEPVVEATPQVVLDTSWANPTLTQALSNLAETDDLQEQHHAMLAAIAECYKQRQQTQYLEFGAQLSDDYSKLFADYIKQQEANGDEAAVKGTGFMQLATLLTDHGEFERAIGFCHQAIGYELSDGTKTGFEGRLVRIEKAKLKAEKAGA